jgi:hypothetical protein
MKFQVLCILPTIENSKKLAKQFLMLSKQTYEKEHGYENRKNSDVEFNHLYVNNYK